MFSMIRRSPPVKGWVTPGVRREAARVPWLHGRTARHAENVRAGPLYSSRSLTLAALKPPLARRLGLPVP